MPAHGTGLMSGMGPMLTGGAHGGGMHEVMQASMMSGAGAGPMMVMGGVQGITPSKMMGAAPQQGMYGMPGTAAVIPGNGSYQAGGGLLPGQQQAQPAGAGVASSKKEFCYVWVGGCECVGAWVWPRECCLAFPDLIHPDQIHDVTTNVCFVAMPTAH